MTSKNYSLNAGLVGLEEDPTNAKGAKSCLIPAPLPDPNVKLVNFRFHVAILNVISRLTKVESDS